MCSLNVKINDVVVQKLDVLVQIIYAAKPIHAKCKPTNTDHENDAANKSQLQERGGLLADTGSFFETSLFKLVQTFSVLPRPTLTH